MRQLSLKMMGAFGLSAAIGLSACASQKSAERAKGSEDMSAESGDMMAKDPPVSLPLTFIDHLAIDLPEQDVFIEKTAGSGEVFRVTKGDKNMSAELYGVPQGLHHNPFDPKAVGPHKKGRKLGLTMEDWFKAKGSGSYTCADGKGTIETKFTGLVPNGVYTMWHFFIALPPTNPFIGTHDLPMGARDGTENIFKADAEGNAEFSVKDFQPCLQLTGEYLTGGLAIAWHSDGKTWGSLPHQAAPGGFGHDSHVQLFLFFPKRAGLQ